MVVLKNKVQERVHAERMTEYEYFKSFCMLVVVENKEPCMIFIGAKIWVNFLLKYL